MIVKDLVNMLHQLDPNAIVCIEAMMDPGANVVKQYTLLNGRTCVYIADNLDALEEYFCNAGIIIDAKEVKT